MKIKHLMVVVTAVVLSGCAVGGLPAERWTDLGGAYQQVQPAQDRAAVVFYREAGAIEGPAVNIYVNQEYLTSLIPGAYKSVTTCTQEQTLNAVFTSDDPGYLKKFTQGVRANLAPNSVTYIKVLGGNDGAPVLNSVPEEQATSDLLRLDPSLKEQLHTLSRVSLAAECQPAQVVLKKYTLQASALFAFDRFKYADMLEKGKQEIRVIAEDVQKNTSQISRIVVVGHADPEGSNAYNQRLSLARAQTVKQSLEQQGAQGVLIEASGQGKSELLISDCRKRFPHDAKMRKECDQPNRRVEVILYGQRPSENGASE